MEGPEKTIIKGAPFDYYIVNIKADSVVLDGFTVTAPDYTGTADASGITTHLAGTKSNLRITNCIIHHIGVDDRSNVSMGSFGINVGPVDGIEIDHNIIYDIHHAAAGAWANGIMVWGNNASVPAKDVHIHDNTIYNISSPEHSLDGAIILSSNTENAVVENNNIYNVRNASMAPIRDVECVDHPEQHLRQHQGRLGRGLPQPWSARGYSYGQHLQQL